MIASLFVGWPPTPPRPGGRPDLSFPVTRTPEELSVVCSEGVVPDEIRAGHVVDGRSASPRIAFPGRRDA
jgi:hypothetical protein